MNARKNKIVIVSGVITQTGASYRLTYLRNAIISFLHNRIVIVLIQKDKQLTSTVYFLYEDVSNRNFYSTKAGAQFLFEVRVKCKLFAEKHFRLPGTRDFN